MPMMRTRAKQKHVASDRARRENVPRHILFHVHKKMFDDKFDYASFWTAYENGSWGGVASRFGYVGKSGKLYRLVDKVKTKVRRA